MVAEIIERTGRDSPDTRSSKLHGGMKKSYMVCNGQPFFRLCEPGGTCSGFSI